MAQLTAWIILAMAGSLAMLAGAFAFQYVGRLAPCHLCLLQRWPHAAAVAIGLLALAIPGRLLPVAGAAAALTSAAIGMYHTGVERLWWAGPSTCSAGSIAGLDINDLLDPTIVIAPVVRCDEVAWQMAGLSMASWNVLLSVALALVWIMAARSRK
jgi:disulfide bond formation protein DsbB